jgi:hypothetical protein
MTFLVNYDLCFPLFAFSLFNQQSRIVSISMKQEVGMSGNIPKLQAVFATKTC